MDVLESEADLSKPFKDLCLSEIPAPLFFCFVLQITT